MRTLKTVILALAIGSGIQTAPFQQANAQQFLACGDASTVEDCFNEIELRLRPPKATDQEQKAAQEKSKVTALDDSEKRLVGKNTGLGALPSELTSTIADFLPKLAVAADGTDSGSNQPSLTLDLNSFLGLPVNSGYKLQLAVQQAELYEPLREAFDAAGDSAAADRREDELTNFDDYSLSFAWNPTSEKRGRSFRQHRTKASALWEALQTAAGNDDMKQTLQLAPLQDEMNRVAGIGEDDPDATFEQIEDPARRKEFSDNVFAVARTVVDAEANFRRLVDESQFFRFADLVNNQPQLHITASQRERDDLAGPDETTARITYEHGFVNVNGLERECAKARGEPTPTNYLACYSKYVAENNASLKAGDRLSVSLSYTYIGGYDFDSDGIAVSEDAEDKFVAEIGYGRYLQFDTTRDGIGRLDVSASYEDYGDDPKRHDRGVATMTYSLRVADGFTLVVGASYANRPEFLGDTDEELSAHLGLNYKLLQPAQQ